MGGGGEGPVMQCAYTVLFSSEYEQSHQVQRLRAQR